MPRRNRRPKPPRKVVELQQEERALTPNQMASLLVLKG